MKIEKRTLRAVFVFMLASAVTAGPALPDGLVSGGHVSGPHTTIRLTDSQKALLSKGVRSIELTQAQCAALSGLPDADTVKKLIVYPKSTDTCTCELSNVAVRASNDYIEVADELFGRDLQKEERQQPLWSHRSEEQRNALETELRKPQVAPEALLTARGEKLLPNHEKQALALFQQALRINPDYRLARHELASLYETRGHNALYGKPDYQKAAKFLTLALNSEDPTDTMMIQSIKRELKIAQSHLHLQ